MKKYTNIESNKVIATCAGGRKSMSSMFSIAFQLLAGPQDELVHIIPKYNMNIKDWYYPKKATNPKEYLSLYQLDTLKLSNFLQLDKKGGYLHNLKKAQDLLTDQTPIDDIKINKNVFSTSCSNKDLILSPVPASYLRYLLKKRAKSNCKKECSGCMKCMASYDDLSKALQIQKDKIGEISQEHLNILGKNNGSFTDNIKPARMLSNYQDFNVNAREHMFKLKKSIGKSDISIRFRSSISIKENYFGLKVNREKFFGIIINKDIIKFSDT